MTDEPVVYESLEAMKMGPRSYTGEQAEAIRQAVANRKPLKGPAPPLEPAPTGDFRQQQEDR